MCREKVLTAIKLVIEGLCWANLAGHGSGEDVRARQDFHRDEVANLVTRCNVSVLLFFSLALSGEVVRVT